MRMNVLVICLCAAFGASCPAQDKTPLQSDEVLARCTKIMKFGSVNEFYKPAKADAVMALGLLGDPRAVPVLLEHLNNEANQNLQFQIVRSLGWLKSDKATPALEKLLKHKDLTLREVAILALEDITGKDYGSKERAAQPLKNIEDLIKGLDVGKAGATDGPFGKGFGEVGKTYRFVFTRSETKDVSGEMAELPRDGWVKVRTRQGETTNELWINLSAVTMILPVAEKK